MLHSVIISMIKKVALVIQSERREKEREKESFPFVKIRKVVIVTVVR